MEEFNIKSNKLQKLISLKQLLQKGVEYIPELQSYLGKIDRIVNTLKDGENKGRQGLKNIGTLDGYYITNGAVIPITLIFWYFIS